MRSPLLYLHTLSVFLIFALPTSIGYSAVILIADAEKAKREEANWLDTKNACVKRDPQDRSIQLPICDYIDPEEAIGWQLAGGTIAAYMTPPQKSFEQGTKSLQASAQNNAPFWLVVADENNSAVPHEVAKNLCSSLSAEITGNWRLPTVPEFKAIYHFNHFTEETFKAVQQTERWQVKDADTTIVEWFNWAFGHSCSNSSDIRFMRGKPPCMEPTRKHGLLMVEEPESPDFSGLDELDQIAAELEAEDEAKNKPKEEKVEAPDYIDPHFLTKNARESIHKNFKRRTYWTQSPDHVFLNHPPQNLGIITNPAFVEGIHRGSKAHRGSTISSASSGPILLPILSKCDIDSKHPGVDSPERNTYRCHLLGDSFLRSPKREDGKAPGDNSICVQQWRQPKRKQTLAFEVDDVRKCFFSNPAQFDRIGRICPEIPVEKAIGWRLNGGVIIGQEEVDKDGDGQKEKYWLLIDQIDNINEANYQYSLQTLESAQNACKNLQYGSLMGEEPLKGWFLPSVDQLERAFCLAKTDGGTGKEHTPEYPSSRRYQNCTSLNAEVIPNFSPDQYWASPYISPEGIMNQQIYTVNFSNGADRKIEARELDEARHRVRCMVHVPVELQELPQQQSQ